MIYKKDINSFCSLTVVCSGLLVEDAYSTFLLFCVFEVRGGYDDTVRPADTLTTTSNIPIATANRISSVHQHNANLLAIDLWYPLLLYGCST